MENFIISDIKYFKEIKEKILEQGKENFHVVADFDRTLTKFVVNGDPIPSLIHILRKEGYLGEDFTEKSKNLAEKYRPIEFDSSLSLEEKKKEMHDWWAKNFKLMIDSKLNKRDLEKVINSEFLQLREGVEEFLDFLHNKEIPLIIFSANELGGDSIKMLLEKKGKLYSNIHIISNEFNWNEEGYAISVKEPIVTVVNKDETILQSFGFYESIKSRQNILLLGDSLGDISMVKGAKYNNLLKIGFLNFDVDLNLKEYKNSFDALILNDGTFQEINSFLRNFK